MIGPAHVPGTGHLGARVSALLDGQLPPEESERAWSHVQECHACRDHVERESWVKRRLACLGGGAAASGAPEALKGSLMGLTPALAEPTTSRSAGAGRPPMRLVGAAAIGSGAVGFAVLGVLALGTAPAAAPTPSFERRAPVTQLGTFAPARETSGDAARNLP